MQQKITKVRDSEFLRVYDQFKAAGFEPRSAGYVANYVVHYEIVDAIAYLRAWARENLADLNYRARLGLQSTEYHRYPKESGQG